MSVVANRNIEAGEEILANYNYSLSKYVSMSCKICLQASLLKTFPRSPEWYRIEWFKHLRRIGWSEEKILSWVEKEINRSGITVDIPPPSKDSERFVECLICREHVFAWDSSSDRCRRCARRVHGQCVTLNFELDFICNVCSLSED